MLLLGESLSRSNNNPPHGGRLPVLLDAPPPDL
jgi:hypothetical protein